MRITASRLVFLAALCVVAASASARTVLVGDADGFGINPTAGLVRATGAPHTTPADTDSDGIIEPGEFLPDLNRNGSVAVGSADDFDHRSAAEMSATNGAELTDRSLTPAGAAHQATFTFDFTVPVFGEIDFGVDHFINFVFGDYDVSPATILIDGVPVPLTLQGGGQDGLVQVAFAVVPWSSMTDGQVIIVMLAPNEPYLAFDFALLDTDMVADRDSDGVPDPIDNCPDTPNPGQQDSDSDGIGDVCDICPFDPGNDADGDGVCDDADNCLGVANPGQEDVDSDGIGDACDVCPFDPTNDADGDGVCDDVDNCLGLPNPGQGDADSDGIGDDCDACPLDAGNDADGDGLCADLDNCPDVWNPDQTDTDRDGIGDACDPDPYEDVDGLCPCDAPWRNHGEYVVCVVRATDALRRAGTITGAQAGAIRAIAGQSDCGK